MSKYLLLLPLLFVLSCKTETKTIVIDPAGKEVPLEIEISNPEEKGFLYLYRYDGNERVLVDSFQTDKSGKAKAIIKTSEPTYYVFDFYENGNNALFLINDAPVSIKVDTAWNAKVDGGEDNALHDEFAALNDRINAESQGLRQQFMAAQSLEDKAAAEQQMTEVEQKYEAFVQRANAELVAFMGKARNSIVAISVGGMLNPDESLTLMKEVADNLVAKYPTSKLCKQYAEEVERQGRLAQGAMSPDFVLKTADGVEVTLSKLRGKYVMIDFWASWCAPCRQENPNVVKVYNKFKAKGFEILGVSVDQDKQAWKEAIVADKLPWVHVLDEGSTVANIYNVTGIPFTVLLDKEGKIIAKGLRAEALEKKLATLM
jgi:peroxiredoxin